MSRSWSRSKSRLGGLAGLLVLVALAVSPLLGGWWLWHSESEGGGSPLLARILVGVGAAMLALFVGGLLFSLVEGAPEGRLKTFLGLVATVVTIGLGFGLYDVVTDWADSQVSPVVETLGVVCADHVGAPEAQPVKGQGPFHAVVIGADGEEVLWSEQGADWRADSVEDTELVTCIEIREPTVETCYYHPPSKPGARKPVPRKCSVVEVWVYAAHSGRQVDHFTLRREPEPCPEQVADDVDELIDRVEFDELSERIADLVRI